MRPPLLSPFAPSTTSPERSSSLTIRLTVYRAEVAIAQLPDAERLAAAARFQGQILQRTPQRVAFRRADLDRTRPSLQELLGVDCRCSLLDVEEIMTDDVEGPRLAAASSPTEP